MAIRLEQARPDRFPAVYRRLLHPMNPRMPEDRWRRLFEQPWAAPGDLLGQVLMDGDDPVGFVSFVHARYETPEGGKRHLCNVSSWVVQPSYSQKAPALIVPVLGLRDATITNLTCIPAVHAMFSRLGFEELESSVAWLRPIPFSRSPWGRTRLATGIDEVLPEITGPERSLAQDHGGMCRHLLVRESGGEHCLAIYTLGRRKRIPSATLHWITPGGTPHGLTAIRRALFRLHGVLLVEMDRRHVPPDTPGSIERTLEVPRLFRSPDLEPAQVPNAYSELTLLEL